VVGADAGLDAPAGHADAPYRPRDTAVPDTGPEPCARGIRAVTADVPPLDALYRNGLTSVAGDGETAYVAQTDFVDGAHVGRLTIVDARTGARRSAAQAVLPMPADGGRGSPAVSIPVPLAIRAGPVPEVLWASQAEEGPFAAVVRFDDDAVGVTPVSAPDGEWVYWAHAAAPSADGFVLVTENGDGAGFGYRVMHIVDGVATQVPLGLEVDTPTVGAGATSVALSAGGAGATLFGALTVAAPEGQALIALAIDVSGATPRIESREIDRFARPGGDAITADRAGEGAVIGARVEGDAPAVRFYWVAPDLTEIARWETAGSGLPLGAVGDARQAVAFAHDGLDLALYVGIADSPGMVRGGERPLVNALEHTARGPPWESSPGTISISYLRGGVEILSLCGSP
jgi:hypothetical protein